MHVNNKMNNKDLGIAWVECIRDIISNGDRIFDEDEALREIRNYYFTITSAEETDIVIRKYADSERISFMKEKYASCNILPGYKISYGKLIYDNHGVNQIEWLLNRLQNKPETKSATIGLHIPGEQYLSCISLLDFKLRNKKLVMSVVYRSQNVLASQPGNFIALRKIQCYLAEKLMVDVGEIEGIILSAHIYERDIDRASEIINNYDQWIRGSSNE